MEEKSFNQPVALIQKVLKHITLFYAILIFLGFYEINSFYEKFNIGIYQFISTGEILVTFMPFIMNILRFSLIFNILKGIGEVTWITNLNVLLISFILLLNLLFKNRKFIKYFYRKVSLNRYLFIKKTFIKGNKKTWMLIILLICFSFLINNEVIIYKNFELPEFKKMWNSEFLFFITGYRYYWFLFVNVICLYYWTYEYFKSKINIYKKYIHYINALFIFIFIWLNIVIKTDIQVSQIRNHVPFEYVSFNFSGTTVNSNDTLVFLSNIRDFMFLRDLKTKTNYIYNLKDVQNLTFRKEIKSQFYGMWKLDKIESLDNVSGNWLYDSSFTGWAGYIIYDGQGHMGVQITSKGYKDFKVNKNLDSLNNDVLKELVKFYQSNWVYFADYKITNNTIEHKRLSATEPKNWGTILTRDFEFRNDTLILTAHEIVGGKKSRLWWIKL